MKGSFRKICRWRQTFNFFLLNKWNRVKLRLRFSVLLRVFRHGVEAAAAKRVAAQNAHKRKVKSAKEAPFLESLQRVERAGGREAAARRLHGGNKLPVEFYEKNTNVFHAFSAVSRIISPSFPAA